MWPGHRVYIPFSTVSWFLLSITTVVADQKTANVQLIHWCDGPYNC